MNSKIKPTEWATFHLKLWFDAADYDYDEGSYTGHGDRLVMEYYDKPGDKHPVERIYFEFDYDGYRDESDATEAIKGILDTIEWNLTMRE